MDIEDIKVGAKLVANAHIALVDGDDVFLQFTAPYKFRIKVEPCDLLDAQLLTTPKYDPCRPFKEGDRVKPRKLFGRYYSKATARIIGKICTVLHDEIEHYTVSIRWDEGECNIDPAYLELVTPVEELEPYSIDECGFANVVYLRKNGKTYMTIPYAHPVCLFKTEAEALAAAEVERDRLNAEYRKEQK